MPTLDSFFFHTERPALKKLAGSVFLLKKPREKKSNLDVPGS